MEDKKIIEYTTSEFCIFLEEKLKEIKTNKNMIEKYKNIYQYCCNFEEKNNIYRCSYNKFVNMLNLKKGKENFELILKDLFGKDFFNFSENEREELNKKGFFTKDKLNRIFNNVCGMKTGSVITLPNSWSELIDIIYTLINTINDKNINDKVKEDCEQTIFTIQKLIAERYKKLYVTYNELQYITNILEKILELYKKNKKIDIKYLDEKSIDILNRSIVYENQSENGKISYENIKFGNITYNFILKHNEEVELEIAEKPFNNKVNKYFKKLVNIPLEKLNYENHFPSYDEERFIDLISKIREKILYKAYTNDNCQDDYLLTLLSVIDIYHMNYYKMKYIDENSITITK